MQHKVPRIHTLFPTIAEARNRSSQIYADHLLILASADFGKYKTAVNLLSLNILGPGSPMCGFHEQRDWEGEGETISRYGRIVAGLMIALNKHQVDFIALQEVTSKYILSHLQHQLPPEWIIIDDDRSGLITCFNGKRFKIEKPEDMRLDDIRRIRTLRLKDEKNGMFVTISNIWGIYDPFPQLMEANLRSLLKEHEYSIVIGDTNSRIAPIDNEPRNITTGIVPVALNFRERIANNIQVPDYPDGGFFSDDQGCIHQLPIKIINYENGQIVEDKRSATELNSWPEFRMILCLDDHYISEKLLGGQSIFEYQDKLKEKTGEGITVRMASDAFNHKAIGIRFSNNSQLYKHIVSKLKSTQGFQNKIIPEANDSGRAFPVVFIATDKLDLLLNVIDSYHRSNKDKQSETMKPSAIHDKSNHKIFADKAKSESGAEISHPENLLKK